MGNRSLGPALIDPGMGVEARARPHGSWSTLMELAWVLETREPALGFLCSNVEFQVQTSIPNLENIFLIFKKKIMFLNLSISFTLIKKTFSVDSFFLSEPNTGNEENVFSKKFSAKRIEPKSQPRLWIHGTWLQVPMNVIF